MLRRSLLAVTLTTAATASLIVALPSVASAAAGDSTCDAGAFAGGDGSVGNPYQVSSRSALDEVRDCLDKNFLQTADINLGGTEWTPLGNNVGYGPHYFTGTYDGGDKNITGLSITVDSVTGIGLFGVSTGTLKNLHVAGTITLSGNSILVGGVVGFSLSQVDRSSSSVTVSAPGSDYVGGLVGSVGAGGISNSSASGAVTGRNYVGGLLGTGDGVGISASFATGAVSGGNNVGGLVGIAGDSFVVLNSYARGAVTATGTGGGLIGSLYLGGTLTNSYAAGAVTVGSGGGLVGSLDNQAWYSVSGNVWDTQTTGRNTDGSSTGTAGLATAAMHVLASFTDRSWDIDTSGSKIWQICNDINGNYPFLSWQKLGDTPCSEPVPTLPPTGADTSALWLGLGLVAAGVAVCGALRRKYPLTQR